MKNDLVVIDTNVLVSSILGQSGYPRKIFEDFILTGKIRCCVSVEVFQEYEDVLSRERFKKYPGFANAATILLEEIKNQFFWYSPKLSIDLLDDKDENKFIELAVEAEASYLITGNSNDFVIKEYRGISICSPKEFYEFQISNG